MRHLITGMVAAGVVGVTSAQVSAVVVLDEHFSAAEGYVNGNLEGQKAWAPQPFPQVDTSAGFSGDGAVVPSAGGDTWVRSSWWNGMLGTAGPDPSGQGSPGFSPGDRIEITFDYQFTLSASSIPAPGSPLDNGGLPEADNFMAHVGWRGFGPDASNNWESAPDEGIGFTMEFRDSCPECGGFFVLFPDRQDANFWNNGGNDSDPIADQTGLVLQGWQVGLNPAADPLLDGGNGLGVQDLESHPLRIRWATTYLGDQVPGFEGFSLWEVDGSSVSVEVLNTGDVFQFTGPNQLQIWETPNVDAYPALYWKHNQYTDMTYVSDAIKYEFCPGGVCSAPSLSGDLDGDGFVGIADLNIVLGNWNQNVTAGDPLSGDPSGDGFVGIEDLNEVLGNWNAGTPPAGSAVPEPATLALLGLGGVAALRRR